MIKTVSTNNNNNFHISMNLNSEESLVNSHQQFFGHGKLLLTGEYLVLDGAKALALPTSVGQTLNIKYESSYEPKLYWSSYDYDSKEWFSACFEFWKFKIVESTDKSTALILQKILRQARKQNPHFLRDEVNIIVETKLGFPLKWGLGSSSTLIYNIAQWAYVSPFELHSKTSGGSGYDVACAGSEGPILYEIKKSRANWSPINFDPEFKDNLYFVYLGKKQDSIQAIDYYKSKNCSSSSVEAINNITDGILKAQSLEEFESLLNTHEDILASTLDLTKVKDLYFQDFWGAVKSLGAWGGDFVMVTSNKSLQETEDYFKSKGFKVFIPYKDLILDGQYNFCGHISEAIH